MHLLPALEPGLHYGHPLMGRAAKDLDLPPAVWDSEEAGAVEAEAEGQTAEAAAAF